MLKGISHLFFIELYMSYDNIFQTVFFEISDGISCYSSEVVKEISEMFLFSVTRLRCSASSIASVFL